MRYPLRTTAFAFLLAGVLGRMVYLGQNRPATYFDWINILLGVYLWWAGSVLGNAAAFVKRWDLSIVLALFWISQAVSSFGWTLHRWEHLNWIIDPSLGIVAFLSLAFLARNNPSKTVLHQ